jgi:hypothetical protein
MKKFIIFIWILGFVSCNNFLTETPKSSMSVGQYFTTPEQATSAVNYLYRIGVPSFYNAGGAYEGTHAMEGGYLSGFFDNEYKGQTFIIMHSQQLDITPNNCASDIDALWNPMYNAIANANLAIKYIPKTPGLSDADKNKLLGQAMFFRALNYFWLVKFFGDVPLVTEPYESLSNLYVKRTSSDSVYAQIVSDLTFAVNNGNLGDNVMPENGYRISQGSAEALLADVYLNMSGYPLQKNKYKEAATVARAIINDPNYGLIQNGTTPDQSAYNIMRTSNDQKEYLYQKEYKAGIAANGYMACYSFPNAAISWGIFKYSITCNVYRPVNQFLWIYDTINDLRIQEKQFFHSSMTYSTLVNGVKQNITQHFVVSPYLYEDSIALFQTGQTGKNFVIYRYAEVLLIAAEAIARTEGVTSEAVGYLADVRSRAYWKTSRVDIINQLSGLSVNDFVKEVWKERLREMPLEFKIWFDIQRTRQYPVTSETNIGSVSFVNVIGAVNPWGKTFTENNLLLPISSNEIHKNPMLTQNPGY